MFCFPICSQNEESNCFFILAFTSSSVPRSYLAIHLHNDVVVAIRFGFCNLCLASVDAESCLC